MTLVEFLLARIAEDESLVLDHWDSDGKARVATVWTGEHPPYTTVASDQGDGRWVADGREVEDARRVTVLFDPARVLAECKAKRSIVDQYAEHLSRVRAYRSPRWRDVWDESAKLDWKKAEAAHRAAEDMVRALASVYSEHADYQPEWGGYETGEQSSATL